MKLFNKKIKLTSEEIIKRIEEAPKDMQLMIAKAFLRDDINNEDIQYSFNEDGFDELNEDGDATVENVNAKDPEGIGALGFIERTSKPTKGNKNYIRKASGGFSPCVKGNPKDKDCDVLSNCVGYASGRFNEIINEARDTNKLNYTLSCNAENFIEKAKAQGLKTGSKPKVGAIGCCQKGATLKSSDGAGHVFIVERVINDKTIYTSESAYGGKAFWNQERSNKNGKWGMGSAYKFRAFIYLPDDVEKIINTNPQPEPQPQPEPTPTPQPEPTPQPIPEPTQAFKVGDKVIITGKGNGNSYGTGAKAGGIGWSREILKIYEGRPYPYQVGNKTGVTGYYKEDALRRK